MNKKLFTLLLALVAIATTAQSQNTINGHEYVDLGLPSGTLWATCNVGANSPEEYGDYFAWGETTQKENYSWSTYRWCDGTYSGQTKYTGGTNGDGKKELDLEDDAAYVNWGDKWWMPSLEQQNELREKCTWEWTQLNGVNGSKVIGPNGNFIFLPAAGFRVGTSLKNAGIYGYIQSRSDESGFVGFSDYLYFSDNKYGRGYNYRSDGLSVRPVAAKNEKPKPYAVWCKDNNTLYFLSSSTELRVGGTYKGQTISGLWSGETVTNSPQNEDTGYSPVAWMNAQIKFTKVVIEESFKNVLVNSTSAWFMGIESIEGLENLNTSNVTSMSFMFGLSKLTDLDLSHFDTSNVKYMQDMFLRCPNLASLNLSHFDTKNVLNMHWMFGECTSLSNLDLNNFNTENVMDMGGMFEFCSNLATVYVGDGWSTVNVTDGNQMFIGCNKLVGGSGTVYDYNHIDSEYARIDGGTANPGYFTDKNAPVTTGLLLNAENFPDANFRAALASELGISEGDEITAEKIAATTSLDVSKKSIADLTGIEHFTALRYLYCYDNQLTSLDVSGCTALTSLRCEDNQLTSLNVSGCTVLANFYCYNNQLTALDVSKNTALIQFRCDNNLLTSIDVSQNTALVQFRCDSNRLTSLDVSQNTALTRLYCYDNQLTSLDVSKNTALQYLQCYSNQLTSLDVSQNTALTWLRCDRNQLTSLDVSKNTALTTLYCYNNQLTSLDVSNNTVLTNFVCYKNELTSLNVLKNTRLNQVVCFSNKIKDAEMDALVASLPTVESGEFYVINTKDENEGNVCTKSQVAVAKAKGWNVYDYNGHSNDSQEYEGCEDPKEDIDPVDEGDSVDFGNDMDENTNLNGNVIGNIFYNIGDSDGKYDSAEGCIVVKKPMSDSDVSGLEGKDIFGEDFKNNFTGIVFKVPAGKGVVKVDAETTGNMLLKVKIGSGDPVEMELNGKLKVTFPYNVSEPTYVYIYAGAASEAKGFGAPSASEDAALKIYGIEFIRDNTPTGIDNGQFTIDNSDDAWYSLDGKKLNGEPKKKGVYIRNGKKVVK